MIGKGSSIGRNTIVNVRANRRDATHQVSRLVIGERTAILEFNKNMNRAMEAMGGRVVRRFRVYERVL